MFIKIILCKLAIRLARLLDRDISGAGRLAETLDGNILKKLRTRVRKDLILVLGTNGKTTTKRLLVEIFRKEGLRAAGNSHSTSEYYGILASMMEKISILRKNKLDYLILEVKDLETLALLAELKPGYIIATNLFREQLVRQSSYEHQLAALSDYLKTIPDATLIFNGDDPVLAKLGEEAGNHRFYYGIDAGTTEEDTEEPPEEGLCPNCGGSLHYSIRNYGQLGDYTCENCGFDKPAIDYLAGNVSLKDGIYFDFLAKGEEYPFDLPAQGFYNIYNILAALALLEELDLGIEAAELYLEQAEPEDVQLDTFYIRKPVFFDIAESEALFNQNLEAIAEDEGRLDVLIVFNEEDKEEETTFIYDSPLSILGSEHIHKVYITGTRAYDLALACRYLDVPQSKLIVEPNLDPCLHLALSGKADKLHIINKDVDERSLGKKLQKLEKKWSL